VALQFKEKVILFFSDVHYFIHKTNWVLFKLIKVDLMHQLEGILLEFVIFFTHSLKTFIKFQKIVDLLNTKGNKFLKKY